VAWGECILCQAPESVALSLIETEGREGETCGCYFKKQPESPEELAMAIEAEWVSCVAAVHYHGRDPDVIKRLGWERPHDCCRRRERTIPVELVDKYRVQ
jgi:hypothetical protein